MDERELIFLGKETLINSAKNLSNTLGLPLVKKTRLEAFEALVKGQGGLILSDDASFAKEHKDLLNRRPYGFLLVEAGTALIEGLIHFETAPLEPAILRHRAKGLLERIWLKDRLSDQDMAEQDRHHALTNEKAVLGHLRNQLKDALALAERRAKEKTDLLNLLSHEIRTPLNGIISLLHFFEASELTPDQEGYLRALTRTGNTVLEMVNGLLEWGKIESGQIECQAKEFEVNGLLEEIELLFRPLANQAGIALRTQGPAQPALVTGDLMKLRQSLVNLVGNALKYTDSGWVSISAGPIKTGWLFEVKDSGKGIAADKLGHLFNPFWQVEEYGSKENRGSGLGLAIVKQLVEIMGGKIEVSSQIGQGSCFAIELPLVAKSPYPAEEKSLGKFASEGEVYLWAIKRHLGDRNLLAAQSLLERFEVLCQTHGALELVPGLKQLTEAVRLGQREVYQPAFYQLVKRFNGTQIAQSGAA